MSFLLKKMYNIFCERFQGLKEKWLKFNTYFTRLPLFIDTVSLVIKKNKIENTLAEIEKHIKFLEENHYIYVYDENDGNNEN